MMRRKPTIRGPGSGSGTASAVDLNLRYSDCRKCRVKSPRRFGLRGLVASPYPAAVLPASWLFNQLHRSRCDSLYNSTCPQLSQTLSGAWPSRLILPRLNALTNHIGIPLMPCWDEGILVLLACLSPRMTFCMAREPSTVEQQGGGSPSQSA
jgi:hypothetical protein